MTTRSVMSRSVASMAVPRPFSRTPMQANSTVRSSPALVMISSWKGLTSRPSRASRRAVNILCMWPFLTMRFRFMPCSSWRRKPSMPQVARLTQVSRPSGSVMKMGSAAFSTMARYRSSDLTKSFDLASAIWSRGPSSWRIRSASPLLWARMIFKISSCIDGGSARGAGESEAMEYLPHFEYRAASRQCQFAPRSRARAGLATGADAALAAEGGPHGRLADAVKEGGRDPGRVEILGRHEAFAVGLHEEFERLVVLVRPAVGIDAGVRGLQVDHRLGVELVAAADQVGDLGARALGHRDRGRLGGLLGGRGPGRLSGRP